MGEVIIRWIADLNPTDVKHMCFDKDVRLCLIFGCELRIMDSSDCTIVCSIALPKWDYVYTSSIGAVSEWEYQVVINNGKGKFKLVHCNLAWQKTVTFKSERNDIVVAIYGKNGRVLFLNLQGNIRTQKTGAVVNEGAG